MLYFTIYNYEFMILDGPFKTRKEARNMIEAWKRLRGLTFKIHTRWEAMQTSGKDLTEFRVNVKVYAEKYDMIKAHDRTGLSDVEIEEIAESQGLRFLYRTPNL